MTSAGRGEWTAAAASAHDRRARRAGGGATADPGDRAGAGHPPAGCRVAETDHQPKGRFAAVEVIVRQGLPAQLACRVLTVSEIRILRPVPGACCIAARTASAAFAPR